MLYVYLPFITFLQFETIIDKSHPSTFVFKTFIKLHKPLIIKPMSYIATLIQNNIKSGNTPTQEPRNSANADFQKTS